VSTDISEKITVAAPVYLLKAIYAPPYSVEVYLDHYCKYINNTIAGVCVFDTTLLRSYEHGIWKNNTSGNWEVTTLKRNTNTTTTALQTQTLNGGGRPIDVRIDYHKCKLQIRNDGTTFYFDFALPFGPYFNLASESVSTFLTSGTSQFAGIILSPSTSIEWFRVRPNAIMNYVGDAQRILGTNY
jgi:hypothetical protein